MARVECLPPGSMVYGLLNIRNAFLPTLIADDANTMLIAMDAINIIPSHMSGNNARFQERYIISLTYIDETLTSNNK